MRILVLLIFFVLYHSSSTRSSKDGNCNNVSKYWFANGLNKTSSINEEGIPTNPDSQSGLCKSGFHCCNTEMMDTLQARASVSYNKMMADHLGPIRELFIQQKQLDDIFVDIINDSAKAFIKMFSKTYGLMYSKNRDVFDQFYVQLIKYYKGSDKELNSIHHIIAELYNNLFVMVMKLIKEELRFDKQSTQCLFNNYEEINPFGKESATLKKNMVKHMVTARTIMQSLFIGRDVIISLGKVENSENDCSTDFGAMTQCHICRNKLTTRPCYNYCMKVLTSCLRPVLDLQVPWKNYIVSIVKSFEELESLTNLESIMEKLPYEMSGLLMHFQSNSKKYVEMLIKKCKIKKSQQKIRETRSVNRQNEDDEDGNGDGPLMVKKNRLVNYVKLLRPKLELYEDLWHAYSKLQCETLSASEQCHDQYGLITKNTRKNDWLLKNSTEPLTKATVYNIKRLKQATLHLYNTQGRLLSDIPSFYNRKYEPGFEDDEDFESSGSGDGGSGDNSGSGSGYQPDYSTTEYVTPPYTIYTVTTEGSACHTSASYINVITFTIVSVVTAAHLCSVI